ncbi:hypothetical protein [Candidatus Uabimicrobium sp. HlEnr_7]|uniref:hypothetical protein n=1 Tax=Candidatus Uabimicrobium helgolandensis TaxID=3095367 RepID=UPI00355898B6
MKKTPTRTYVLFAVLLCVISSYIYFFVYGEFAKNDLFYSHIRSRPHKYILSEISFQVQDTKAFYNNEELKACNISMRQVIAKNDKTSPETLAMLAKDEDIFVKRNVASNPSSTSNILSILADDKDVFVRRLVVRHPSVLLNDLYKIAKSRRDSRIYWEIARSTKFDENIWKLWQHELSEPTMHSIANNKSCPPTILDQLSEKDSIVVRLSVVQNSNTSRKTLQKMTSDTHMQIADIAKRRLKEQQ